MVNGGLSGANLGFGRIVDDPRNGLAAIVAPASGVDFWLGFGLLFLFALTFVLVSHAHSVRYGADCPVGGEISGAQTSDFGPCVSFLARSHAILKSNV